MHAAGQAGLVLSSILPKLYNHVIKALLMLFYFYTLSYPNPIYYKNDVLSVCLSMVQSRKNYCSDFNDVSHKRGLYTWE